MALGQLEKLSIGGSPRNCGGMAKHGHRCARRSVWQKTRPPGGRPLRSSSGKPLQSFGPRVGERPKRRTWALVPEDGKRVLQLDKLLKEN